MPQAGVRWFTFFRKRVTDPPGAGFRKRRIERPENIPRAFLAGVIVSMLARDEGSALREKLDAIVYLSTLRMHIFKPRGRFLFTLF